MTYRFKPCPFCGSDKVAGAHSFVDVYMIKCLDCGAITSFRGKEEAVKAIEAWNNREQKEKKNRTALNFAKSTTKAEQHP